MTNLGPQIIKVIYELLPGFITSEVIYNLTSSKRPSKFEQVVRALIFTAISKMLLIIIKSLLFLIGQYKSILDWSESVEFVTFILISIFLGLFISWCINHDFPLSMFRKESDYGKNRFVKRICKICSWFELTNKTQHSSEWYSFFVDTTDQYVVLHLKGRKRLRCRLLQYPDYPEIGHFIITNMSWLTDTGIVESPTVAQMLIAPKDVIRVEKLYKNNNPNPKNISIKNNPL